MDIVRRTLEELDVRSGLLDTPIRSRIDRHDISIRSFRQYPIEKLHQFIGNIPVHSNFSHPNTAFLWNLNDYQRGYSISQIAESWTEYLEDISYPQLIQQIIYMICIETLLVHIGLTTQLYHNQGVYLVVTGGMAIRHSNPSYITDDLDLFITWSNSKTETNPGEFRMKRNRISHTIQRLFEMIGNKINQNWKQMVRDYYVQVISLVIQEGLISRRLAIMMSEICQMLYQRGDEFQFVVLPPRTEEERNDPQKPEYRLLMRQHINSTEYKYYKLGDITIDHPIFNPLTERIYDRNWELQEQHSKIKKRLAYEDTIDSPMKLFGIRCHMHPWFSFPLCFFIMHPDYLRTEKAILINDLENDRFEFNPPTNKEYLLEKFYRTYNALYETSVDAPSHVRDQVVPRYNGG